MKKLFISALLIAGGWTASSAQYPSMMFTTIDGEVHLAPVEDLRITFVDGDLVASSANRTLSIPLDKLMSMQFSEEEASIDRIVINSDAPVEVYDLSGVCYGTFVSAEAMRAELQEGIYVVKQADGATSKIFLKK